MPPTKLAPLQDTYVQPPSLVSAPSDLLFKGTSNGIFGFYTSRQVEPSDFSVQLDVELSKAA